MNAVALKIKKIRTNMGLTQEQMAERVHLSLKAWQKIENGITRLDLDRLNQIAEILETSLVDLINADEGIYVHEIKHNEGGFNSKEINIHQNSLDSERELYKQIIADKDKEIAFLRDLLNKTK